MKSKRSWKPGTKHSLKLHVKQIGSDPKTMTFEVVAHQVEMKRRRERFDAFMGKMWAAKVFKSFKVWVHDTNRQHFASAVQHLAWKAFNEGCRHDDSN